MPKYIRRFLNIGRCNWSSNANNFSSKFKISLIVLLQLPIIANKHSSKWWIFLILWSLDDGACWVLLMMIDEAFHVVCVFRRHCLFELHYVCVMFYALRIGKPSWMQLWSIGDFIQKENNVIVMCDTFCAISCISSSLPQPSCQTWKVLK